MAQTSSYHVYVLPTNSALKTFKDIANAFAHTLSCRASTWIQQDKINICFGLHEIGNKALVDKINPPDNSIIVNLEQLDSAVWLKGRYYYHLVQKYQVWDYSHNNIKVLKSKGITNVKKFEVGYSPSLETTTRLSAKIDKDIDVLFYGCINKRRLTMLKRLSAKHKVSVYNNVWGEERDELITRAKIVLNIHFYDAKILEVVRLSHLVANRAFVISEPGWDDSVNTVWSNRVVMTSYDDMVDTVTKYLADDQLREDMAEKNYQHFKLDVQKLPCQG